MESVDAAVVGTGFGGGVAAYRLAEAGKSVVVFERGRAYPPGSFARTPSEFSGNFWSPGDQLYGLFETWSFRGLEGLVSSGLGGGSLIYANVLLRKDPEWFVQDAPIPGGGYESWPISREDLDPHYDEVERMLGANPYPYHDTPKTIAFESSAAAVGMPTFRPPLAVTFATRPGEEPGFGELPTAPYGNIHGEKRFSCRLCGECDIGCNYGAKNTIDHTYISAAAAKGADIRTLHEVKGFQRVDGMWHIRYRVHDPATGTSEDKELAARTLVLAAGTFGTSYLLLKNRASVPDLSPALGTHFCGNGDLLGFLMNASERIEKIAKARDIVSSRGPVITSAVRTGDILDGDGSEGRGYYIEDAGYPGFLNWLMEVAQLRSVLSRSTRVALRLLMSRLRGDLNSNISRDLADAIGKVSLSSSSMPVLGMGRDVPDGRMYIEESLLQIDWTTSTSIEYFARMRESMERLGVAMGARFADNPLWWAKRVITVHPLGGVPMGRTWHEGVTDGWGRVYGAEDLWVVDGSVMPGPVGPNPALTIAAFSDRAMTHAVETLPSARAVRTPRRKAAQKEAAMTPASAGTTTVRFTEQMKGFVTLGEGDPRAGYETARLRDEPFMFELTIETSDIDGFVADPAHPGTATGFVDASILGGRAEVEQGWFNLFVEDDDPNTRQMVYRLWLRPDSGAEFTMVGFKDVHDDPGMDLWDDTTTLFVQLLSGFVEPSENSADPLLPEDDPAVVGAGILRIKMLDFGKQMTTFRTEGPGGAGAIVAFGSLFLGQLWETYGALAAKD